MTATATDTYLLLRAFCDELARCGVTDACTSPGSRSTPMVLSLAREPGLRTWSHIDERVAGFFAVGLAKQSQRPVAITVTSGTAAAELAPAVIEAAEARVPLIVLTTDRPPELRDVGAGQTIDQVKLFGGAAKQFVEVGVVGEATVARLRWIRTLACRAVATASSGRAGVVHLNFPLREPLVLDAPLPPDPLPGRPHGRPWVAWMPNAVRSEPSEGPDLTVFAAAARTVVVAGRAERAGVGVEVAQVAERAGWVLLADPLSGARAGASAIAHYDALLRDEAFATGLEAPELVIRLGDVPTSKPLRAWLAGLDPTVPQLALDPEATWHDPDGVVSERVAGDPVATLTALASSSSSEDGWLARWRDADARAAEAIGATIAAGGDAPLNEPLVAREVAAGLPAEATLFVAASMPIRDVETFAPAPADAGGAARILANRGANGIDGTVASALGAAAAGASDGPGTSADASSGPVVLLIGDVALAYDLSALLSAKRLGLDLTIVLINNDGGGIFHFLPVSSQADAFEHHVATPHGLDFAVGAQLYGARHVPVATAGELRAALAEATRPGAGVTIVEARSERDENVRLHRRIWQAVSSALG
ncbi:2-succinyl-5-enolpyruvyl-6-hydroxy-3-cyclohexene-1-carboxylic-acid synthase [Conexibacter sp. JD483]|uniref:2-succinyl-5-enolpyruvyl-6-hydroxy-3- cyclohexene-1-carboxylic-acid synthase n=1 Tax=unclassified Conexibacter TaxID=2627773 RepID=UPI002719C59F|nr:MULTISPECIES: 2-succinyl-5-enolpyruvyl-6-hydroxy-3-cyclohexene-1-carboxylic-acid synthase [unclassified Conexibacter]MDO8185756.1 2-succinyl-5-enolpyruvyl-6-hydroxy-3-cyclohexene-1-carboxylic-acid synthase [Conexibacter sp. CPCC 205706]MDO8199133.1 2-succinyl-5-enolpyruvyl-6-hydroxy-3-cyclohexene-1-carboxylic-acid synthase [Conexibacter sp. CPCC 205762]MDR9369922.1 2-succinyl-5-enolpyruvyl-6-hydroxy-3-cyclohexene-1-carboxylic-acid synthase [Conexibacter sp. JD483]